MAMVVCAWALAGATLCGLGVVGHRLARVEPEPGAPLFWTGFAIVLAVLQVWQLFHPVDGCAAIACVGVGVPALAVHLWRGRAWVRRREDWAPSLFLVALALWLSNRALAGNGNPDSGVYFVSAVRWMQEHRLPPGLANLNFTLGLNHAYFLYVALLDTGPFHHQAQHLANGLLLLAVLWNTADGLWRHVRREGEVRPSHTVAAVLLAPLLHQAQSGNLTSPSADFAVFMVGAMLVLLLLRLLEASTPGERWAGRFRLTVLASAGIVLKTSLLCVALPVLLAAGLDALRADGTRAERARRLATVGLLGSLWAVPWMVRGIVTSGYPLYPLPVAGVPVPWRLPRDFVVWCNRYIQAFARNPDAPVDEVLADWRWVRHWAAPLWLFNWEFVIPVLLLLGGVVAEWVPRRRPAPATLTWAALLLLGGLGLWFLLAPDLRFAGALLWGLAGVAAARGLHGRGSPTGWGRAAVAGASLALTLGALPEALWLHHERLVPLREPGGALRKTDYGLEVRAAERASECFESLCTAFFDSRLRLRRDGDLDSGFLLPKSVPGGECPLCRLGYKPEPP